MNEIPHPMQAEDAVQKVNILSVEISRLNLRQTLDQMIVWIRNGQKKRICVTPVNCVLWAYQDKELKDLYNSSDLNVADGVPLIWASKLLGSGIAGRVSGIDLLPALCRAGKPGEFRHFFMGAKEGVAAALVEKLRGEIPDLNVVGYYSPPFAHRFSDEENHKMIAMINAARPTILWVSLTAPKQDYWIREHFDKLNIGMAIGVGGAFELTAGLISRAPRWMQRNGLEWFYRFLQEPRRLFRRYFLEAPQFIPLILMQYLGLLNRRLKR